MCTLIAVLSLAVYYSVYKSQIIATFNPNNNLAAFEAKALEFNLKCECQVQSIPFKDFSAPTVVMNDACVWVKNDLEANYSSCRALKLVGFCRSVRDACYQSGATIDWVLKEYNSSVLSSTSLMLADSLKNNAESVFSNNFKIGELISSSPKRTVKAWAAANMPRLVGLAGTLAMDAKAQKKKVRYLFDRVFDQGGDDSFDQRCAASKPIVCGRGNNQHIYDDIDDYDLIKGGDMPVDCARDYTASTPCNMTKVADGECNLECMSPECLFDGGDCASNMIFSEYPRDLRQSFTLMDARLSADVDLDDYTSSWLDLTPDLYINATRRRCDDGESWLETGVLPKDTELYNTNFEGRNFSMWPDHFSAVTKADVSYPTTADGSKVDFQVSMTLGCDQYEKELKQNLFQFYSVSEFRYFMSKMRELGDFPENADKEFMRDLFNTSKIEYKQHGFDFLENFASTLMDVHTDLETAMDNLFVDEKSLDVDYAKYFEACQVSSCTYTYLSVSSAAGMAAVILGLLGGIQNALSAGFLTLYEFLKGLMIPKSKKVQSEASENPA